MPTPTYNSEFVNELPAPGQIGPGGTLVTNSTVARTYVSASNSRGNGTGGESTTPYGDYPAVVESPLYRYTRADGTTFAATGPRGANGIRTYAEWTENERGVYDESTALLAAMFLTYTGTTDAERVTFLKAKGRALQARAKFIETRVSALLTALKQYVPDTEYKTYLATFTGVLAIIPGFRVFGVAASAIAGVIVGKSDAEQKALFVERVTLKLDAYKKEFEALAKLAQDVDAELVYLNSEPINKAPLPGSVWLYVGGGAALLLLLIWLRNRKKRPRRK